MNVYIGTSGTLQNAYIGEYKGFTPGSNTLAYFPFKEDGLDKMGNFTLNNVGTQQTIGRRFTSNCILNTNPTGVKTVISWVKANTIPTGSTFQTTITLLRCAVRNANFLLASGGSPASIVPCFYIYYNNSDHYGGSKLITAGEWYLLAFTYNTKLLGYCNGTEYTVYNGSISGTTDNYLILASGLSPDIELSEFIIEDRQRTAQEIQNYYNNTKSNYGL